MSNQKNIQNSEINESLVKSEAFILKYKKQLITGFAAFAIIIGGIFAYIYGYSKPREDKAQELLGVVMQRYIMSQDFEHALKGEGKTLGLLQIVDKYGSTDAGNLAKYEAGLCSYQLGKTKDAIKYLEDFSTQGDETVSAQAVAALGHCYAADKQTDKAVESFKKAAGLTETPALCAEYLLQAGIILESQKKNDEALQLYKDIKAKYPSAPVCMHQQQNGTVLDAMIDKYIERLSK